MAAAQCGSRLFPSRAWDESHRPFLDRFLSTEASVDEYVLNVGRPKRTHRGSQSLQKPPEPRARYYWAAVWKYGAAYCGLADGTSVELVLADEKSTNRKK
jgi:hypothetical protein